MKLDDIDVSSALATAQRELEQDDQLSPALKSSINLLILIVTLLSQRLGLNSKNSSIPPSSDPNREKQSRARGKRSSGGQPGHIGKTLEPVDEPDLIETISIDRRSLPRGNYRDGGYERRQVVDIDISRVITEYRAQMLIDQTGHCFVAEFPKGVSRPIQYGNTIKAHSVYLSQFQLLPYRRIVDYFHDQLGIPLSEGSIVNFNLEASERITSSGAEALIKQRLQNATLLHVDETGINIGGKQHWLHVASNRQWTWFHPHEKRGVDAMESAGILPAFQGILCHDHWKPYYTYQGCLHSLCNAHHLRELERAWEQDHQSWAKDLQDLLKAIHKAVIAAGGALPTVDADKYRTTYRKILEEGEVECPPPDEALRKPGQKGRLKRSKARNLLERLRDYEEDTLRFMDNAPVPFTNNQGENDIRMTKVQQKISGCFRSFNGALMFCQTRSFIASCRKQNISASDALGTLFAGELPAIFA